MASRESSMAPSSDSSAWRLCGGVRSSAWGESLGRDGAFEEDLGLAMVPSTLVRRACGEPEDSSERSVDKPVETGQDRGAARGESCGRSAAAGEKGARGYRSPA